MATFLSMWMDGLTPEIVQKAERELGETEEIKAQALKDLRRLIHGEKDLKAQTDDAFLLRFLRVRKFKVKKAFNTLRNYYKFKLNYSGILTNFIPSELMKIYEQNMMDIMPSRMENGSALAIIRFGYFDYDSYTTDDLIAAVVLGAELAVIFEASQVCGGAILFDCDNFTLHMLRQLASPKCIYRMAKAIKEAIPFRITGFYVVNEPLYFHLLLNPLKQFLPEKIKSRIYLYGNNLKSLHQTIPPELLPEELGGKLGPMDNSDIRRRVLTYEDYFENMKKYGYQEKTSQVNKKLASEPLGIISLSKNEDSLHD